MKLFERRTTQPTVSERDRRDARQEADDATQWRDYHTFLTGRRTLLAARMAASSAGFERSPEDDQAAAALARLDRLPTNSRALFEAILAEQRPQAQTTLEMEVRSTRRQADPDAIEQQALTTLIAQAEGEVATEHTPRGFGWFPRGTPGDVRWYALDVAELLAAPVAAAYTVTDEADTSRRSLRQAAVGGGALLVFVLLWFLVPRGGATSSAATVVPLVKGGAASGAGTNATAVPMEVQPIGMAIVRQGDQQTRVVVGTTTANGWPAMTATTRGYWQRNRFAPLALCLDDPLMEELTGLVLPGGGGWPDRAFALSNNPSGAALIIETCRGGQRRYGTLQQLVPLLDQPLGQAVTLPGTDEETISVTSIQLIGPGQDPTLPDGQARVLVLVAARPDLDWPTYAPTLTTPDGQTTLPAEIVPTTAGATLRYLIPLPSTALPVAWDLTSAGRVLRWRANLEALPSRLEVLGTALAVRDVQVVRQADDTLLLALTLLNQGSTPLTLTRDDIRITLDDRLQATPDLAALGAPLAPGERRSVSIPVPIGATLALGPQLFRIDEE